MMVTLKLGGGLTSEEGQIKVTDLSDGPLSVGRSPEAGWTLIDPSNRISGMHFELFRQGESVMIVDQSSGGTSLDQQGAFLQKGQPARLNDTTRLILPVGEVRVSIDRHAPKDFVEDAAERSDYFSVRKRQSERPAASDPFKKAGPRSETPVRPKRELPSLGSASDAASRQTGQSGLSGPKTFQNPPMRAKGSRRADPPPAAPPPAPLSFDEVLDESDDSFLGPRPEQPEHPVEPERDEQGEPRRAEEPEHTSAPESEATAAPSETPPSRPEQGPQPGSAEPFTDESGSSERGTTAPSVPDPSDEAALRMLFEAVGLDYDKVPPEERVETAVLVGRLVVSMTDALRRLLDGRRAVKRELGVAGTQVEFGANPLKFAPTSEAAVEGLIRPLASGYITGEEAVADALSSMQSHQLALVGAIRGAVRVALDAFDPTELERKLESRGLSQVVPVLRRAELWERFREHYTRFAEQANDDIRVVIGRELDKLYAAPQTRSAGRRRLGTLDEEPGGAPGKPETGWTE